MHTRDYCFNLRATILESVESVSSSETTGPTGGELPTSYFRRTPSLKQPLEESSAIAAAGSSKKGLYKRMASDTDLWMSLKAGPQGSPNSVESSAIHLTSNNKFKSFLESMKEGSVEDPDYMPKPGTYLEPASESYSTSLFLYDEISASFSLHWFCVCHQKTEIPYRRREKSFLLTSNQWFLPGR